PEVEGGVHLESESRECAAVLLLEESPDVLDVPGSGLVREGFPLRDLDRLGERRAVLLLADEAGGEHPVEDVALAPASGFPVTPGIVAARRLRQPGEQSRLGERELRGLDVEEGARGG